MGDQVVQKGQNITKDRSRFDFPYSNKLYGDNAAMIGIAAYFKAQRGEFIEVNAIDRNPNAKIDS